MSKSLLVSVIIPVYNRREVLKRALDSVKHQTYTNLEVIVVDDGSTEDIQSVVERFRRQVSFPVLYCRQRNAGPGVARRTGLARASGEFIQYLDSDDEILPEKIQMQVELMQNIRDAVMCYTPTLMVSQDGTKRIRKFSTSPAHDLLATALQYRRWHTSSCLWRYPDKKIAFWSDLYVGEDVVHDVSVGIYCRKIAFLPRILTIARTVGDQVSSVPRDIHQLERYKENVLQAAIIPYKLLLNHGLHRNPLYAEPLAERFFYTGLKLAKWGDFNRALKALKYPFILSRSHLKRYETALAIAAIRITKSGAPNLYRWLFHLHRFLTPPTLHCYRGL